MCLIPYLLLIITGSISPTKRFKPCLIILIRLALARRSLSVFFRIHSFCGTSLVQLTSIPSLGVFSCPLSSCFSFGGHSQLFRLSGELQASHPQAIHCPRDASTVLLTVLAGETMISVPIIMRLSLILESLENTGSRLQTCKSLFYSRCCHSTYLTKNRTASPDGRERVVLAVNGSVPGPTLIADWGDNMSKSCYQIVVT